jgi:hypothetical protein
MDIEWSGPRKCHQRGCVPKATFHSLSALKSHLKNVHISPLICTHPGCIYKKPFGKQCDLKRHLATVHSVGRKYECLENDCQETFSRKDKMLQHAREKHELYRCSCNHCTATVFAVEKEGHLQKAHGNYECVIGSCKSGRRSFFSSIGLDRHLRTIHRVDYWRVPWRSEIPSVQTFLFELAMKPAWRDCKSCLAEQRPVQ